MKTNQMNGLYPIIRRVRRPLVPVEGTAAEAKPAEAPKEERPAPESKASGGSGSTAAEDSTVNPGAGEGVS